VSIRVFCSYSHKDRELKKLLEEHISPLRRAGRIEITWSDDALTVGTEFDPVIREELEKANIILLLLSSSFFNSDYCWNIERRRAFERHDAGEARAVPVLLKPCHWKVPPIDKYTVVPRNLQAVSIWPNQDEAFAEVITEIDRVINEMEEHLSLTGATHVTTPSSTLKSVTTPGHDPVFHCVPVWGGPVSLRHDGIAELLPDIVLHFKGEPGERRMTDIWL
jgi:hypothetical protein